MEFKDYYKILGVDADADDKAIKAAYRKLARKYHPDVSAEEDAESSQTGKHLLFLKRSQEDEDFGDKSTQTGKAQSREEGEGGIAAIEWHRSDDSAKPGEFAVVSALVDDTDQKEEHGGDATMVEHLEDRSLHRLFLVNRHPEHDKPHVADTGIGDQFFEIGLGHRAHGSIEDVDHR